MKASKQQYEGAIIFTLKFEGPEVLDMSKL